jgi:hypothetical protein
MPDNPWRRDGYSRDITFPGNSVRSESASEYKLLTASVILVWILLETPPGKGATGVAYLNDLDCRVES